MRGTRVRALTGEDVILPGRAVQSWQAGLRGLVLRAGDDGYEEVRRVWNGMIDRRPTLICIGILLMTLVSVTGAFGQEPAAVPCSGGWHGQLRRILP
jgi:hypothetical protein